jgi:hypothetical protein
MNRGLIEKTAREAWLLTLVLGIALAAAEGLLAYVLPTFRKEIAGAWAQVELVQNLIRALLGSEVGDAIGPRVFQALPWVHPIVLAIVWTHQLVFCTRIPAGEIDRGTIDLLLGLPVSRWQVYVAETAVFLVTGMAIFAAGTGGNYAGCLLANADSFPGAVGLAAILANGYCLYLAVGGITYFASSLAGRRGRAVGWSLAAVLASFLLTFLAQFWKPAQRIAFLSLLDYYRPVRILQDEAWPLADMAVLLAIGAISWTLGGLIFDRRDIRTV